MHLIAGLGAGGAERQLNLLVHAMAAKYEQRVVSLLPGGVYEHHLRQAGIPVVCINLQGWRDFYVGQLRLEGELKAFRPQIIHCWMYHANLLGAIAQRFRRVPGRALIWAIRTDIRGEGIRNRTRLFARVGAMLSKIPAAIVYNATSSAKTHHEMGYTRSESVIIPNGIDVDQFRPDARERQAVRAELGIAENEIVVGMAARAHPSKDHKTLLAAVKSISEQGVSVRLVLCGSGMDRANSTVNDLIVGEGLGSKVLLLGERTDVQRLMAAWDVCCLATLREAFPNTVAEAMACGLPCVASAVGDVPLIIGDPKFVVPARDGKTLADVLLELSRMTLAERTRIGLEGRERVMQQYSLSVMSRTYDSLYQSLLGRIQSDTISVDK